MDTHAGGSAAEWAWGPYCLLELGLHILLVLALLVPVADR